MKDVIAGMLRIERQARKIVEDADEKAREALATAQRDAVALEEAARRDAQANAVRLVDESVEQARAKREQMLAEIDRENARFRDVPPDKAQAAVQLIHAAVTGRGRAGEP